MKKEYHLVIIGFVILTLLVSAFSPIRSLSAAAQAASDADFDTPNENTGPLPESAGDTSATQEIKENNEAPLEPTAEAPTMPGTEENNPAPAESTAEIPAVLPGTEKTSPVLTEPAATATSTPEAENPNSLPDGLPTLSVMGFDKTDILIDIQSVVCQNGIEISENGKLNSRDPVSVEVSFEIPLRGLDPLLQTETPMAVGELSSDTGFTAGQEHRVFKGDMAAFRLSNVFKLVREEEPAGTPDPSAETVEPAEADVSAAEEEKEPIVQELWSGEQYVGRVEFTDDDSAGVSARVLFDGDDSFYNGSHENIRVSFSADLEYAPDEAEAETENPAADGAAVFSVFQATLPVDAGTGDRVVTILEKKYTVTLPESDPAPTKDPSTMVMLAAAPMAAPSDKTDTLTNKTVIIRQDGVVIGPGDIIDSQKPIEVTITFGVPVLFDDPQPANPVLKGDWADFEISKDLELVNPENDLLLSFKTASGEITVGHVDLINDPAPAAKAHVDFDGEDEIFSPTGGWSNVQAQLTAQLEYAGSDGGDDGKDVTITVLDKTFTVRVPPVKKEYTVTKVASPANLQDRTIEWEVTVEGKKGENGQDALDLAGYVFSDNLTSVGAYDPGSFTVGGIPVTPVIDSTTNTISYTFPTGSTGPQTVRFKTKISDADYYKNSNTQTIQNTAELLNDKKELLKDDSAEVTFTTPEWIKKTGEAADGFKPDGTYDPTNRTITWNIVANPEGLDLKNVVITDQLPAGLTWQSAKWQEWVPDITDPSQGSWVDVPGGTFGSEPAGGAYTIGDINAKIRLSITAIVPDQDYSAGTITYTNSASIRWDGSPADGIGSGGIGVGIGYPAITKVGSPANLQDGTINWTVTVDPKGQTKFPDNLVVYDLLVYGNTWSGFPAGYALTVKEGSLSAAELDKMKTDLDAGLKSSLKNHNNQSYSGSFSGTVLDHQVITIHQQDGTAAADLIRVVVSKTAPSTFSFKSRIMDPAIFAGNSSGKLWNTASLFNGTTLIMEAEDDVTYTSKTLEKRMLKRETDPNTITGANNHTGTLADGFDYVDQSVIFRLSVNANGADLTGAVNAAGSALGTATLTDTLPAGWEFVAFPSGAKYLIFSGTGNTSNGIVTADSGPLSAVSGMNADFTTTGTVTFTFTELKAPYVILVKAKPDAETLKRYFSQNGTTIAENTAGLNFVNWPTGVEDKQQVSITSQILNKSLDSSLASTQSELRWTLEYKPQGIPRQHMQLEDTIPDGVELRRDAYGNLLLTDPNGNKNISMFAMRLNPDGSTTQGSEVTLALGQNVSYDPQTRLLTFTIPDGNQGYSVQYVTDITGEPGRITNTVNLTGTDFTPIAGDTSYVITQADGSATMQRAGWIQITKTDGPGTLLAGAEFTLYALDNTTVIRQGRTGADGKLSFRGIPTGQYILRETTPPSGYIGDSAPHTLSVSETGSTFTVSLDGRSGTDANLITVKNYLDSTVGSLTIRKRVEGNAADPAKQFEFTVTFSGAPDTYSYIGYPSGDVPNGTIRSGDTIRLAHGQSITITGLPKDATFTVTETDYAAEKYATASTGDQGTIVAQATQTAEFINTKNLYGSLTIRKRVEGNSADPTKQFEFTVSFSGAPDSYPYTGSGVPDSTIQSGDTVRLAHGQSITITGLPWNTAYTVTETDYSAERYLTASTGNQGVIVADSEQVAEFVNTKNLYGNLSIRKRVEGNAADPARQFEFTVSFSGAPDSYPYTGSGVPDGTIRSGDTIRLAHGQSIRITGLPKDTAYTVAETDYSAEGYKTESNGTQGMIITDETQIADFINSKNRFFGGTVLSPQTGDDNSLRVGRIGFFIFGGMFLTLFGLFLLLPHRKPVKK